MEPEIPDIGDSQISSNPKVLLADDVASERAALAAYLRNQGYDVIEASDGQTAIQHLKDREVNALLLDLNMPVADGFDVLAYLQKHRRGLPVTLLSGMPVNDIQRQMHDLPDHQLPPLMLKPIDPEQLIQVLELQLRGELPRPDASGSIQVST